MYRTCLYCSNDLGTNEVLEPLPIGRRVAFDAREGRLWVVCRSCEKWNLVPFDTRLETIDACERLFVETRVRYSTDNIGIARLREGLELVRIGPALRPEFAAWRYGDQFGRRRMRMAVMAAATLAGGAGFVWFGRVALLGIGLSPQILNYGMIAFQRQRVALRIAGPDGVRGVMTPFDVQKTRIQGEIFGDWWARIPIRDPVRGAFVGAWHRPREVDLTGDDALTALGRLLPKMNPWGASSRSVREAVDLISYRGATDGLVRKHLLTATNNRDVELRQVDRTTRLALEMAAHEDTERQALAGELKLLERQWKQADELARIADSLALPVNAGEQVEKLRQHGN